MVMKVQRENGVYFVDLGDGWQETLHVEAGVVTYGPAAGKEEMRRPLTKNEAKAIRAAILARWPALKPHRFCR